MYACNHIKFLWLFGVLRFAGELVHQLLKESQKTTSWESVPVLSLCDETDVLFAQGLANRRSVQVPLCTAPLQPSLG